MEMVFIATLITHERNDHSRVIADCRPRVFNTEYEAVSYIYRHVLEQVIKSEFLEIKPLIYKRETLFDLTEEELIARLKSPNLDLMKDINYYYFDYYRSSKDVLTYFNITTQPVKSLTELLSTAKTITINGNKTSDFSFSSSHINSDIVLTIKTHNDNKSPYTFTQEDITEARFEKEIFDAWVVGWQQNKINITS